MKNRRVSCLDIGGLSHDKSHGLDLFRYLPWISSFASFFSLSLFLFFFFSLFFFFFRRLEENRAVTTGKRGRIIAVSGKLWRRGRNFQRFFRDWTNSKQNRATFTAFDAISLRFYKGSRFPLNLRERSFWVPRYFRRYFTGEATAFILPHIITEFIFQRIHSHSPSPLFVPIYIQSRKRAIYSIQFTPPTVP